MVKNPPASAGDIRDAASIAGSGGSLEEGMATHSSILAWRIPWTEEPCGLQPRGSQSQLQLVTEHARITYIHHIFFSRSSIGEHRLCLCLDCC